MLWCCECAIGVCSCTIGRRIFFCTFSGSCTIACMHIAGGSCTCRCRCRCVSWHSTAATKIHCLVLKFETAAATKFKSCRRCRIWRFLVATFSVCRLSTQIFHSNFFGVPGGTARSDGHLQGFSPFCTSFAARTSHNNVHVSQCCPICHSCQETSTPGYI